MFVWLADCCCVVVLFRDLWLLLMPVYLFCGSVCFCNCLLLLICYYFCLRGCGRFVFDLLFELVDASIVKLDYCMGGWFAVCLVGLICLCGFAID